MNFFEKEWGAHGRSWRGWERNDTNWVPIKFSKIKKVYLQATSGRGRCWTRKRPVVLTQPVRGSAFLFTAGVSTGFHYMFQLDHQKGDYGDWQSNNLHVSLLLFCMWRPLTGACQWPLWNWWYGIIIQFYIHSDLEATLHWITLRPSLSSRPLASLPITKHAPKPYPFQELWEELALILGGEESSCREWASQSIGL